MKKLLVLSLLIAVRFATMAQSCAIDFLGTKTLYKLLAAKYTPAPAGYQPVFINHVGRHGARHLTKEVNISFAYKILLKADSTHALTATGMKLWQMVKALDKVEKGNVKSISAEGVAELQAIGERMAAQNANVFKNKISLNVDITKEIRTKQSADAFLTGLKKGFKTDPAITEQVNDIDLRFYDESPVYASFEKAGEWEKNIAQLETSVHFATINNAIAARVFKPAFLKSLPADAINDFTGDVFGFATIVYSLNDEVKKSGVQLKEVDFKSFFTCDELAALSKLDVADDYYKKGPGINPLGIQVKIAAPLLVNFLTTADEFVKTGNINAQLRFAHAETISPFATLLGISVAYKKAKSATTIESSWKASQIIPLSSNIQWIFYKKPGNANYLVKILLNEKEARITGLTTKTPPYYQWSDLRSFYWKKLNSLNIKPGDDMKAFLENVK